MTTVFYDTFPFIMKSKPIDTGNTEKYSKILEINDKPKKKSVARMKSVVNPINNNNQKTIPRGASFVVGQKLRESKWFTHDELRVFCAVVETGFIVEKENEEGENQFGVALWKIGYEKSKNPEYIEICSLTEIKGKTKVQPFRLLDFWPLGSRLRINNKSDKDNTPHKEEIVRNQIEYAKNYKQKYHNSWHFAYWCRYETPQVNFRIKQISDSIKWGNIGISTGLLMLKRRRCSSST